MGRRLRMTAELGDWLTELGQSGPATAAEVGAAVVAVLDCADLAGLAAVGVPGASANRVRDDPREAADVACQRLLADLQQVRRSVADVAGTRHRAELQLSLYRDSGADPTEIATAQAQLADARRREEQLTELSQGFQWQVDAFRSAVESAKAMYTAAQAQLRIAETLEAAGDDPEADLARLRDDYRAAEERLRALRPPIATSAVIGKGPDRIEAADLGAAEPSAPPPAPQRRSEPAPGLLELRADPLGSDTRILLAVEPAGTVTLLAVLEGPEAVKEYGAAAIAAAGDLLTEIRDEGWPADVDEVALAGAEEFVARFLPADDGHVRLRAEAIATSVPLQKLREQLNLTIAEVAVRSGLPAERVADLEVEGLRAADVHEAVALARALGARLELPAASGPVVGC